MPTVTFRQVAPSDIERLYAISLATGDSGNDAARHYRDGRLIGHIYSAPYAVLCPETCLVAEDAEGVAGYAVGTLDTRAFEARLERDWWPALRLRYPEPAGAPSAWSADQRRCHMIHHPRTAPEEVARACPAHLHMNLLPRLQGRGIGRALLELWLSEARQRGAAAVHVATGPSNPRAVRFWEACGFVLLDRTGSPGSQVTLWYGCRLGTP